jgi:hypothetical protein
MKKINPTLLLLMIIIIGIAIRVSYTPSEIGWDSYRTHEITSLIIQNKYIAYDINAFSVFGLYPYSYATAVPIVLSIISEITKINIEVSICLFSIITFLMGLLGVYTLTNYLNPYNKIINLSSAFLFSMSPLFLFLTTWTATTRALYVAMIPLFIYYIIKAINFKKIKYIILAAILYILLLITHNLALITIILCIPVIIFSTLYNTYFFYKNKKFLEKFLKWGTIISFIIYVSLISTSNILFKLGLPSSIFETSLLKLILRYLSDWGVILPFYIFGMIHLLIKKNKKLIEWQILIINLPFIFLFTMDIYSPTLFLIPACAISYYGLQYLEKISLNILKRPAASVVIMTTAILLFIIISLFSQIFNPGIIEEKDLYHERYLSVNEFSFGEWIHKNGDTNATTIGTDNIALRRISAFYPCAIIGRTESMISCGVINKNDVVTKSVSPLKPSFWNNHPFVLEKPYYSDFLNWVKTAYMINEPRTKYLFDRLNIEYFVTNKNMGDNGQKLSLSIKSEKNKVFDNGGYEIWYLN